VLTLYQAEWCPFSSAVRELLTELGLDFVARQVPAWPEDREELRRETGNATIPVLVTDDGHVLRGTEAIFPYLATLEPWTEAEEHRQRYVDHAAWRQADGVMQLLEHAGVFRDAAAGTPHAHGHQLDVVDNAAESRYEIHLDGELAGYATYEEQAGCRVFVDTVLDPHLAGHGLGLELARRALDDARDHNLAVVPLSPFIAGFIARNDEYRDLLALPDDRG